MRKKKVSKSKEKEPDIRFQKDTSRKYDPKVKIKGELDSVLKVFVDNPSPILEKRKGNKKK
ncbi:MAG: hypothetical protein ABSF32_08250 [Ignavibacteria bacterium]|jgi:hypothetical protein